MAPRTRRKLDVLYITIAALVVGGVALFSGFVGRPEQIRLMWVTGEMQSTSVASITEVIDWDFGAATDKHGIYRDFVESIPASVTVTSPDAPSDVTELSSVRLRIGDPGTTVSNIRRYVISYDLDDAVSASGLDWNAVGTEWTAPIKQAEVNFVGPYSFTDIKCLEGTTSNVHSCTVTQPEPGHLVVQAHDLAEGEGVRLQAGLGAPLASAPALPAPPPESSRGGVSLAWLGLVGAVATLVGALPTSMVIRRRGRERVGVGGTADAAYADAGGPERLIDSADLAEMSTIEFAPPKGLPPANGGVLLAESVRQEHKVAWLLQEAIDGSVVLDDTNQGKGKMLLQRHGFGSPISAPLLNSMFGGREEILLGKYDSTFASGWSAVGKHLQDWMDHSGLWDEAGDRRRLKVRLWSVLAVVLGLAMVVISAILCTRYSGFWLVGVGAGGLLVGFAVAGFVRSWELKVRTARGSGLWLQVESFRRFLHDSESQHVRQAAELGVLREYTAWAVAVGEADHWSRVVAATDNLPDTGGMSGMNYALMAVALNSATSHASTAPSSSGGGGVGGGGGGGGGGGSW